MSETPTHLPGASRYEALPAKVLVTGASGHLGYNLVAQLQAAGFTVRASVRDPADVAKTRMLEALGNVEIVGASLQDAGSLARAIKGVDAVVHAAAVYDLGSADAERIVSASVDGVTNTFEAAKAVGIRRIVLTSSVVTLPLRRPGERPSDERDWTSDLAVPYIRGKTLGEQRAWALAERYGIALATILPGAFGGPGFNRPTPTIDAIEGFAKGTLSRGAPPATFPYCDVRDVARAHVLALQTGATGRFIATTDPVPTLSEIGHAIHGVMPGVPAPPFTLPRFVMALPLLTWIDGLNSALRQAPRTVTRELAATMRAGNFHVTSRRAREVLGWNPEVSLPQSLADTIRELRRLGRL